MRDMINLIESTWVTKNLKRERLHAGHFSFGIQAFCVEVTSETIKG